MSSDQRASEVLVIGAGIIGLAVAWRARQLGLSVTVLEQAEAGGATSRVAAGMLAPVSEGEVGQAGGRQPELGLRSAELLPAFAAELGPSPGPALGLRPGRPLVGARDQDAARALERP